MSADTLPLIRRFQLLRLTVEDAGPFRQPFTLDFTDRSGTPGNLFLLAAPNGLGKTLLLNTLVGLVQLLDRRYRWDSARNADLLGWITDAGQRASRAQLDVRLELSIADRRSAVVLSLFIGKGSPAAWDEEALDRAQASQWAWIAYSDGDTCFRSDAIGRLLPESIEGALSETPSGLFDRGLTMPTVLFFPAHRRVVRPPSAADKMICEPDDFRYQPVHIFGNDGQSWGNSLDNLLVWHEWLADGRYQEIQKLVDRFIFNDTGKTLGAVNRAEMRAEIVTHGGLHRLDQLSHGERALMQLFVRIATHMTGNTVVVIDELDLHLHPIWRIRLLRALKALAKEYQGLSFIFTTHLPELIRDYAHECPEEGLIKIGHVISESEL